MRSRWAAAAAVSLILAGGLSAPAGAEAADNPSARSPRAFGKTLVIARVPLESEYVPSSGTTIVHRSVDRRVVAKGTATKVWVQLSGIWRQVPYRFDPATFTLEYDERLRARLGGDPLGGRRAKRVTVSAPRPSPSPSRMSPAESADDPAATARLGGGWREAIGGALNAERGAGNAAPLRVCPSLSRAAQAWANHIATTGVFAHTDGPGSIWDRFAAAGYADSIRLHAENLAYGPTTVDGAMAAWKASPLHYENLMTPQFRDVGLGSAIDASGQTVWVATFSFGGQCA